MTARSRRVSAPSAWISHCRWVTASAMSPRRSGNSSVTCSRIGRRQPSVTWLTSTARAYPYGLSLRTRRHAAQVRTSAGCAGGLGPGAVTSEQVRRVQQPCRAPLRELDELLVSAGHGHLPPSFGGGDGRAR